MSHSNVREYFWGQADFEARAVLAQYALCLGQARLLYGPDVSGDLPAPVSVMHVGMEGLNFHFSAFQLNTMDLDGGSSSKKNIFWNDGEVAEIAEKARYELARPVVEGFNPEIFRKLAAMYLYGARQ